ncbi:MAG: hypothetical protein K0R60_759, partial [Microbacterium sp.]|nr:hypothetical protein [Microbacterium sp.]
MPQTRDVRTARASVPGCRVSVDRGRMRRMPYEIPAPMLAKSVPDVP